MKRFTGLLALLLATLAGLAPARAATFVQDGAGMFSANTISTLTAQIGSFNAQTGKQIVVVTVPSLNGETLQDAAANVFSEQKINGMLIFIAKDDRKDILLPGTQTAQFFPTATIVSIRQSMEAQFKNGDFDGGIATAVGGVLNVFQAHLNTANVPAQGGATYPARTSHPLARTNGVHISMFMWIVFIVIGYLILRSLARPRSYGGGGPGYGGGPGGPGYGGGYGGGFGGGGGFWSGMLGGLGGAWLGNEMFGNHGAQIIDPNTGALQTGIDQGGGWGGGNAGGWGSDSGADMGGASAGDFSGGGFGSDSGGGFGGGDFGGGGGDSGGGW
ncbi:MAG TPA: TPM domain-containing protein [Candidatus Baltobacteraceae bacterium]|nr:TPM domain-containing protein [Candidatus Baltobacteraceae bacterium]